MSWGRVLSSSLATVTVAGGVVVVVAMSGSSHADSANRRDAVVGAHASLPAIKTFAPHGSPSATRSTPVQPAPAAATSSVVSATQARTSAPILPAAGPSGAPSPVLPAPTTADPRPAAAPTTSPAARPSTTSNTPRAHRPVSPPTVATKNKAAVTGSKLPLRYSTGNATRVLTVTAHSTGSTVATVQAWTKVAGDRWRKVGTGIAAHIGSDGMSSHASEYRSATPMGSFTLTQAFGHNSDPGTSLPYFKTTPSDYWISDSGPKYNTHQRCSNCGYNDGVNEHLYYETPFYNYAVVIDYNTRNAPGGVKQGAGSAFFLHVTDGNSTAGCVAIPQSRLIPIMRWLRPSAHPRILIGTH